MSDLRQAPLPRGRGRIGPGRGLVAALVVGLGLWTGQSGAAEASDDLNLFQLVARAELVARVRVIDGSLRFASVEVLETIKGQAPATRLRVAFRDFNWSLPKGEPPIVFPDGQEEILLLVPYDQVKRTEKNRDVFELFRGPAGRIILALEGPDEARDAVRRLAEIAGYEAAVQVEALRKELTSRNRLLAESVLSEVRRLRAADPSLFPVLGTLLGSPGAAIRAGALDLVRQVFRASGAGDPGSTTAEAARAILAQAVEIARNDPDPDVRVEAVRVLATWPHRGETAPDLEVLASGDPDQDVRYEARKALISPR